ncbi:MAG: O-methyltransferase [Elusimicrobia bacterium]|nr:MAG: O-methyltransferase [Elusimicrobiota bacterium]
MKELPDPKIWSDVDRYLEGLFTPADPALDGALKAADAAGLPPIQVSATQGKLLYLLAKLIGARRILEVGTLAGYSAIWMARALPAGGKLVTLEADPLHARVATENLKRAGLELVAEVRVGRAVMTLPRLEGPFDMVFIDADKESYPEYLTWALRLTRRGSLIVADNVVRDGAVSVESSLDPRVQAVRRYHELVAAEPTLSATVLQTVGVKGYDGLSFAVVV